MVWFTKASYSDALILKFLPMGVSIGLESTLWHFFSILFVYFSWKIEVTFVASLICCPKKKSISSIMLISNSFAIRVAYYSHRYSEMAPKNVIIFIHLDDEKFMFPFFRKKVLYILPFLKPLFRKNLDRCSYQVVRACFNLYMDLMSFNTWFGQSTSSS